MSSLCSKEAYRKCVSATWPRIRFFVLSLASLVQTASVSYPVACLESRPSFSFQTQTRERGPPSPCKQTTACFSESSHMKSSSQSASPQMYFLKILPKGFLLPKKSKNVPTRHGRPPGLINFQTYIISLHPILTLFSRIKWSSSFSTFPFIPTWLFISGISFFLKPLDYPPLIWKGHFQVILCRKCFWSQWPWAGAPHPCDFAPYEAMMNELVMC